MSNFYCIPAFIMHDKEINHVQKLVYTLVFGYTNMGRRCFYNNQTIGDILGIKVRQVQNCIAALKRKSLITTQTENGQRFIFTVSWPMIESKQIDEPVAMQDIAPPHAINCTPPMQDIAPIIDKVINKVIVEQEKSVDTQAAPVETLKKYEFKPPKKINVANSRYIQKAINHLAEKGYTLDLYLEYLTVKCSRRLLPYISNGVERTNGFGNILGIKFINDTLNGSWEDRE